MRRTFLQPFASLTAATLAGSLVLAGPLPSARAALAPDVEEINARAVEKFKAKEYDEAVELFKQAYDMKPEPNYLFNIGRVYEQKGDFKNAVDYYGRFLREPEVDLKSREIALDRRRVLTGILDETEPGWNDDGTEPDDTATEPQPQPDTTPQPGTEDKPEKQKPTPMRIAGYALLGVGGAALITGAAFAGVAQGNKNALDDLTTLEERDDEAKTGKRNALIADVMLFTGAALAVTGLVLVIVSLKKKPKTQPRAALAPAFGAHGGGVSAVLRF